MLYILLCFCYYYLLEYLLYLNIDSICINKNISEIFDENFFRKLLEVKKLSILV